MRHLSKFVLVAIFAFGGFLMLDGYLTQQRSERAQPQAEERTERDGEDEEASASEARTTSPRTTSSRTTYRPPAPRAPTTPPSSVADALFVAAADEYGVQYSSPAEIIALGHAICSQIDGGANPYDLAARFINEATGPRRQPERSSAPLSRRTAPSTETRFKDSWRAGSSHDHGDRRSWDVTARPHADRRIPSSRTSYLRRRDR
jgi:hypothetical protein